jgi:hypothetical protein
VRDRPQGIEVTGWLSSYADDVGRVSAFCEKHGILSAVEDTIRLVNQRFPSVQKVSLGLSEDPEGGEEKLVVSVAVKSTVEEAFAAYNGFVDQWVAAVGWEARKRLRLSYGIA